MKHIKRTLAILLALVMTLSMAVAAFADAQTGSLVIDGTTAGKQYDLYKVFDLTYAATTEGETTKEAFSYTVNADFEDYFTGKGIADPVDYVSKLTGSAVGDLAKDLVKYALEKKPAPIAPKRTVTGAADVTAEDGTVTATTTTTVTGLEYGYYVMNPLGSSGASAGNSTMFSLDTVAPNAQIKVKGEYPTPTKTIVEGENRVNVNELSIGDEVTFELKAKVPDMTGYSSYYFCFNDVLSKGLTFKEISSVKIDGEDAVYAEDHSAKDANGGTKLYIQITNILDFAAKQGKDVVVTYKATLNKDAEIGTANPNEVTLEYSNDPKVNNEGEDQPGKPKNPTGESEKSKTETFTTSLTIQKRDQNNKVLTGATFKIEGEGVNKVVVTTKEEFVVDASGEYWKLKDGTYTTDDPAADGMDQSKYDSTTTKYKKTVTTEVMGKGEAKTTVEAAVDANGKVTFAGLGEGTYTITETVVPNGYNAIAPITVKIAFDKNSKTFTCTEGGATVKDNKLFMDVINQSGNELPSTGGVGTTIFYVIGSILVLGAAILLVSKKRMNAAR